MRIRSKLAATALATGAAGLLAMAPSAHAADTTVTFSVASGLLSISAPTSANLAGVTATVGGTSVTGSLGSTTVTDTRGQLAGTWAVTASSTDFSAGAGKTIAKANATLFSGLATATSGTVVFVPTTAAAPVSGAGGTIASATGVVGSSSVTYAPTMAVAIPSTAPAGDYSGVVTQTVA